jgi:hypothetical protein
MIMFVLFEKSLKLLHFPIETNASDEQTRAKIKSHFKEIYKIFIFIVNSSLILQSYTKRLDHYSLDESRCL